MKALVSTAALITLIASGVAMAQDSATQTQSSQIPAQMTAAEMDQVVAAGVGLGLNPKMNGDGLNPKQYLGEKGNGLRDGSCVAQ